VRQGAKDLGEELPAAPQVPEQIPTTLPQWGHFDEIIDEQASEETSPTSHPLAIFKNIAMNATASHMSILLRKA
jgi:hypothetical protein